LNAALSRESLQSEAMLTSEHAIVNFERGQALPDRLSRKGLLQMGERVVGQFDCQARHMGDS